MMMPNVSKIKSKIMPIKMMIIKYFRGFGKDLKKVKGVFL